MYEIKTTGQARRWLGCLGWKTPDDGQRLADGCWRVFAQSCGHTVVALADGEAEAWSAACSMALRLTTRGELRLPFRP